MNWRTDGYRIGGMSFRGYSGRRRKRRLSYDGKGNLGFKSEVWGIWESQSDSSALCMVTNGPAKRLFSAWLRRRDRAKSDFLP